MKATGDKNLYFRLFTLIFMFIFACDSTSPIEKALYYVSMQVLVDRKVNFFRSTAKETAVRAAAC